MPEYKEVQKTVTLPKGIGLDGYLLALRGILQRPRVQEISLSVGGEVTYRRFALPEEPEEEPGLVLETLLPYGVVRQRPIEEIPDVSPNAAVALGQLFACAAQDGLTPVLFVGGTDSRFWGWYQQSTGCRLPREEIYGLPFLSDPAIEDDTLLLCSAYSRAATLSDTQKSYKIVTPAPRGT
jgi:hypothetical protein